MSNIKHMKRFYNISLYLLATIMLLGGCKEEEIPYFTGSDSANFWVHVSNFSLFGATTQELPQDTLVLNIALSGDKKDFDRKVKVIAIEDPAGTPEAQKRTTASPNQYEILDGVIPANELYGKVKIVLKNPEILSTQPNLKVRVEIVENEHFGLGLMENNYVNVTWSREILQPATWNAMRFFFCAVYSTQVYKIFMEVTGLREFYYYEGMHSQWEGFVMGTNFGNRVRELSAQQGSPLLHDSGPNIGLPIVPIY